MAEQQHWLMKSEPDEFGIDDLERVRVEPWSGVRNYMARANLRRMQVGDLVLFHHSSVEPPGVAGLARVAKIGVIDEKQFDPASPYYEPRATREAPIWDCVDVEFVAKLPYFVAMDRMRAEPACADMLVLKRGMRLSVQPVTPDEYAAVVALGNTPPPPEVAEAAAKPARKPAKRPAKRAAARSKQRMKASPARAATAAKPKAKPKRVTRPKSAKSATSKVRGKATTRPARRRG